MPEWLPIAKVVAFAGRHRWSLPLATLAALCFATLARELREQRIEPFDAALAGLIGGLRGQLDQPMLWLTRFGSGPSLVAVTLGAAGLLLLGKRRRESAFVMTVGIGIVLLGGGLKLFFHRDRPEASSLYLLQTPHSFSFPSGHAFGSTAVLFGLVIVARVSRVRGWRFGALAVLGASVAIGVCMSRVYFGVHFPSDVLGGMLAGAGWVSALTGFFYPATLKGEDAEAPAPP